MSSPRIPLILRGLAAVGAVGLGATAVIAAQTVAHDHTPQSQGPFTEPVMIDSSELRLVCPSGLLDPTKPETELSPALTWTASPHEPVALGGGGSFIDPGPLDDSANFPEAITLSGTNKAADYALLANNCMVPRNRVTVVAGSTEVGEDTTLSISNSSGQPVQVGIRGFGATGALGAIPQPLTIPARSTLSWIVGIWFPDEPRLALSLEADGEGVAAWVQTSGYDGEVTAGTSRQGAKPLSTENVFPGISTATGVPSISLLNPTEKPLPVTVQILGDKGPRSLPGTENLVIDPGAVFRVDLKGIGDQLVSIAATADKPFAASIAYSIEGKEDPVVTGQKMRARTVIAPAIAAERFLFPLPAELNDLVRESGFSEPQVQLVIANSGTAAATLVSGDQRIAIPAGSSVVVPEERWAQLTGQTDADSPLNVAIVISAQGSGGPVESTVELGLGGFESVTRLVSLTP